MKRSKLLILSLLILSFLLVSFRCTNNRWYFVVRLKPQNSNSEIVDNLNVKIVPDELFNGGEKVSFTPRYVYNNDNGSRAISSYSATLYDCSIYDVPLETRYLDWTTLAPILDNYKIIISDPDGVYEDKTIPSIRTLFENSDEHMNRKLSGYDANGNYSSAGLSFNVSLEKKD